MKGRLLLTVGLLKMLYHEIALVSGTMAFGRALEGTKQIDRHPATNV